MKKVYNSRWWATLVGLLIPLANHIFNWGIPTEETVAMAGIIAAFVLGESYRKAANGNRPPTPPDVPGLPPVPRPPR